jgi:hypothetical protein
MQPSTYIDPEPTIIQSRPAGRHSNEKAPDGNQSSTCRTREKVYYGALFEIEREFQIRSTKGATNMTSPQADIEQMAFVVMMDAVKSANQDLKMIMDEVKAMTAAKGALRSLLSKVRRDVAANAGQKDKVPALDFSAGMGSEDAYHHAQLPVPDPDAKQNLRLVHTDLYNGQIVTVAQLRSVQDDLQGQLDSMSEMSEIDALRLQMTMDRRSKLIETLSNILKKLDATSETLVRNIK